MKVYHLIVEDGEYCEAETLTKQEIKDKLNEEFEQYFEVEE